MLTYCIRKRLFVSSRVNSNISPLLELLQFYKHFSKSSDGGGGGGGGGSDPTSGMIQLFQRRFFIPPEDNHAVSLLRGRSCAYGPLGVDIKRNLLEQWWSSVVRSRPQVFGISTLYGVGDNGAGDVEDLFKQTDLTKEQLGVRVCELLRQRKPFRTSLLQGALAQYIPSLELMNRKLPFGLAETGLCYQPEDDRTDTIGCSAEVTEASLVWFCSPRTSSQWLDYWTRQRLQWWRKFALGPSDFNVCDVQDDELIDGASRGAKVLYKFPWGTETLETLWMLGDAELLKSHLGNRDKLQCRDGKKVVVPHVLSLSANMDRGTLAVLLNSLQDIQKVDSKQRLHQRMVLKLHPTLAPVKVALDMGKGSTSELRQVCEGLLHQLLEVGISAWPGYMDTMQSSMDKLHTKYDEMGVLFTVMVGENTLENGLLLIRNRDTTVRETMHISEIREFILKYISKAENI
ncbi:DNA polymerase subunit gamma-2, mitochondrial isoform X1 [Tachysurus fulvidraco]|uniref:DNA polymerase subunit gamma-2, mitochondrial isoform X1 n=1 Tax=Tachysurus fulvidraco TaxID=1234273 RepID=UPI001FEF8FF9|nr:DNA polymerase subunit gamma-2, mitochondrial isoform X1 [Tachysurus fulvidraco]